MNRITNMSVVTRINGNLNRRLLDINRVQMQLSTGKKISRTGDDPLAASRILAFKAAINETRQLTKNAEDAVTWIQSTELALSDVTKMLQRVRELALMGGSGILEDSSRYALSEELNQINEHLLSIANTTFDGERYLFAGNMVTTRPFELSGGVIQYHGDTGAHNYEIVRGTMSPVNISGQSAFLEPDLFSIISDLSAAIMAEQPISPLLARIDLGLDNILQQRSICGARMNRYEMTVQRYIDEDLNFSSLLSLTQDIDLAESLMRYHLMENTYQAALKMAARALQPSILDYIR